LYEITVENNLRFGAEIFDSANWIEKPEENIKIEPLLLNLLDRGEAAVIQTAINKNIKLVCIDDAVGRRVARLNNLEITGSL
jgi:predicted nucleic acid-binding protein